jgi:hypothetical protein
MCGDGSTQAHFTEGGKMVLGLIETSSAIRYGATKQVCHGRHEPAGDGPASPSGCRYLHSCVRSGSGLSLHPFGQLNSVW